MLNIFPIRTIEREASCVLEALKKFDTWVFGGKIQVVSDHNPLTYLTSSAPHGAKLSRWALVLQRYINDFVGQVSIALSGDTLCTAENANGEIHSPTAGRSFNTYPLLPWRHSIGLAWTIPTIDSGK
ncbi:hypothetical protein AVEN_12567-1 [Araneus ventricosus]|uniref:Reverse transcriptase RNase H-like domain-containing protein n=1 Tax=Araneus ventricosus TaxID=182803 RepID=A0A4Y2AAM3_ARAVE|nr:hypothetical protein AVEN_12567-1 [Araneus ventricosus]